MTTNDATERTKAMGARIVEAREKKGLRQAELAREIGVIVTTMWRYERGECAPGADVLRRIAEALDVSIDWIVTGGEARRAHPCASTAPGFATPDAPARAPA
jgi:transcriptional regulator with XRE-family HTH domain